MDLIAKKYRVLKKLGQGAMGDVYLVLPPRGDPVALKLLKSMEGKEHDNATQQFENEFKILKKLSHPNIGQIFDYGYDHDLKKIFFTLPWLKGTDIYNHTKELSFEECEKLFVETLRALNYLHQKGLFHCDLKPGNIYIEEGKALLIDFGLTGYFGEFIVGTPTYLAPEIFQGNKHTIASDIYALGIIFYNCLTRSQPFSGKSLQEVYDRHRTLTPPPLYELNQKVPKYFSDIVAMMINKKAEERFPSAASVIEEIDAFSKRDYTVETSETLLSYLPTQSEWIGRQDIHLDMQSSLNTFLTKNDLHPFHVILIHGKKHVGKSKVVQKIKNDLQLAKSSIEEVLPPLEEDDLKLLKNSKAIVFENIDTYSKSSDEQNCVKQLQDLLEQKIIDPKTTSFLFVVTTENEKQTRDFLKIFPEETTALTVLELHPYSKEEMKEYLTNVIGQKEIPQTFLDQFFRNTNGLPGIAQELIGSLIKNGLLFDSSGRWNEDLLSELDHAFDELEVSENIEHEFEKFYNSLDKIEEEIAIWLSVCPHRLTIKNFEKLVPSKNLQAILHQMKSKNVIREEEGSYLLYRKIFQNFISHNLPDHTIKKRHTELANPLVGLEKKWALYHLSYGDDDDLALNATEKLAKIFEAEGDREKTVETYFRLLKTPNQPIEKNLEWAIEASHLLIWLDRFQEAYDLLSAIQTKIEKTKAEVNPERFLALLEKKGLALLHLHEFDRSKVYFQNGLKFSKKNESYKVHQLRFENDLAEIELVTGNHEKAVEMFKHTRDLAQGLSLADLQTVTNNDLGHVYLTREDYEKAIKVLAQDMQVFSSMKNQEPLARALYAYAQCLQMLNKNDRAIRAYQECIRLCKKKHYLPLLLRACNGLGTLYASIEMTDNALENYQRALELSVRLNDSTSKSTLLFNQGYIYFKKKNFALALRRFSLAIQTLENKEKKLAYDNTLLSRCYNILGTISVESHQPMKALSYFIERKKIIQETNANRDDLFSAISNLAEIYLQTRLKNQFFDELAELRKHAKKDFEKQQVKKLEEEWQKISDFDVQENTGKIDVPSPIPI